MTQKNLAGLLLALLAGCSCLSPGPDPDQLPADCATSVLDQRGSLSVAVGDALLFRDGAYYRVGVLASAEVLESYPEQLRIKTGVVSEETALPVSTLLPACQALGDGMKAQYTPDGENWRPVEVKGFRDEGVSVALAKDDTHMIVGYQSMRFIPQGDRSDTQ